MAEARAMRFEAQPAAREAAPESILPARASGLTYRAGGTTLVDGLDFELTHGPRSVLIGPNGAGKSITLRLLHGLLRPTSGEVAWAGQPPRRRVRMRQALVFQHPVLLRRSVAGNVDYVLKVHRLTKAERRHRVEEVLAQAGLTALAKRSARVLSGGEQQRLAIARAWAIRPEVLFLDEPSSNLDPAAAHAVEEMIAAIHARGTKIVMTTHDMGQARRLADEILFLHRGRLAEHAPAQAFFDRPRSEAARAFVEGRLLV